VDPAILQTARDASNKAISLAARRGAAARRLIEIEQELVSEPVARAQYDLNMWYFKIKKAMEENRTSVDNYPWIWFSRADPEYVHALRESLGTQFQVIWKEGLFGNQYTQVSW